MQGTQRENKSANVQYKSVSEIKYFKHCRANVKKKQMAAADKEENETRHRRIMDERTDDDDKLTHTHCRMHAHKQERSGHFANQSEK